jgi:hypothetical protein
LFVLARADAAPGVERSGRNVSIDNIARIAKGLRIEPWKLLRTTEPGAAIWFRARRPLSEQILPPLVTKVGGGF